jgi:Zn-dependent peptidase ImmA (M78 family)
VAEDHHLTIRGRRWLLRFARLRGDAWGWTFYNDNAPKMLIDDRLRGAQRMETVLHEIAHAVLGESISEETVTELARVQRRALVMLGWREVKDER